MAFCITFGTHDFHGHLKGYENVTAQCRNCGNWSARCMTEWPFFTICFLPLIPMACGSYKLVACPVCNFKEDLVNRPDVESQANGGGPPPGAPPQGGPNQGWGAPPPAGYGQKPPPIQEPPRYG